MVVLICCDRSETTFMHWEWWDGGSDMLRPVWGGGGGDTITTLICSSFVFGLSFNIWDYLVNIIDLLFWYHYCPDLFFICVRFSHLIFGTML